MWILDGGSIRGALAGGYVDETPMPVGRSWPMAQVIGDRIYAYGGKTSSGGGESNATNTTLMYDFVGKQWSYVRSGPFARVAAGSVEYNNKMHLFGGWISSTPRFLDDHHIYTAETDLWSTGLKGPKGRIIPSWVRLGKYAYLFGGYGYTTGGTAARLVDHWRYDLEAGVWLRLPDGPAARNAHAAVPYEDGYLVIGGIGAQVSNLPLPSVFYYNAVENSWTSLPDFPLGVSYGMAFDYMGEIYHVGGESGADFVTKLNRLYKLDPATKNWDLVANMDFTSRRCATLKYGGDVYLLGGDIDGRASNRLIRLI